MTKNRIALPAVAMLTLGLVSPVLAGQVQVTFDPSAAGVNGIAFQADALTGGEVSRISNEAPDQFGAFDWTEIGYLDITGTILNGAPTVPTGLGSAYSMYLSFTINGHQPNLMAAGFATSASMTLYFVDGVSTFAFDGGDNATVTNIGTPVAVASLAVDSLTTGATVVSFDPLALDLNASLVSEYNALMDGVFSAPVMSVQLLGAFSHPSDGVTVLNGGQAFLVSGGVDTITFAPEPASMAVLAVGLFGTLAARKRRRRG